MNCPFCLEEVKAEALVCRTCHRDLMVPKPLMEANAALTAKVATLEAEVAALKKKLPREMVSTPAPARPPLGLVPMLLLYVVFPVLALVAIHYLLVIRLDAKLIWLRIVSILLPALFGFWLEQRARPRWQVLAPVTIGVAAASVLGMSIVVHLTDGDPILPHTGVVWRETLEYVVSIALSYVLGSLIWRGLHPVRVHAANAKGLINTIAVAMAKAKGEVPGSPKTLEQRVERLVKLMNLGISAATAAGAIYTGMKAVVQ